MTRTRNCCKANGEWNKFAIFDGDKIKVIGGEKGDEIIDAGAFTLDAGKTPKTIDLKGKEGAPLGRKATGVTAVRADALLHS
jgi:uncharacterized protein (TIGR03067 family)